MLRKMLVVGVVASLFVTASAQAATVNFSADNFATTGTVTSTEDGYYTFYSSDASVSFDVYASLSDLTATEAGNLALWFADGSYRGGALVTLQVDALANTSRGYVPDNWQDQLTFSFTVNGALPEIFSIPSVVSYQDLENPGSVGYRLMGDFTAEQLAAAASGDRYLIGTATIAATDAVTFDSSMGWYVDFNVVSGLLTFDPSGTMTSVVNASANSGLLSEVTVPEPGTYAMLCGLGLVGAAWYRRNRRAK